MKKASAWLLVIGWISAVLGGLVGIFIGAHIASAKATTGHGERAFRYDDFEEAGHPDGRRRLDGLRARRLAQNKRIELTEQDLSKERLAPS